MAGENSGYCLGQRQQILRRDKSVEQLGLVRHRAQSPAHVHLKSKLFLAGLRIGAFRRDQSKVVHAGESASMLRAAAKRWLKLAAKILAVRMS